MLLAMDHLITALLNTALDPVDPLETPLGVARWWTGISRQLALAIAPAKPRFDSGLAAAMARLRGDLERLLHDQGASLTLAFRGDASDAILFQLTHAMCVAAADGTLKRIRRCSGQPCGRYFLDETKNASKRWCSLRCMERARAPRRRTISR